MASCVDNNSAGERRKMTGEVSKDWCSEPNLATMKQQQETKLGNLNIPPEGNFDKKKETLLDQIPVADINTKNQPCRDDEKTKHSDMEGVSALDAINLSNAEEQYQCCCVSVSPLACHLKDENYAFQWYDLVVGIGGCCMYIFDVVTDILLFLAFFQDGHLIFCAVTLAIILTTFVFNAAATLLFLCIFTKTLERMKNSPMKTSEEFNLFQISEHPLISDNLEQSNLSQNSEHPLTLDNAEKSNLSHKSASSESSDESNLHVSHNSEHILTPCTQPTLKLSLTMWIVVCVAVGFNLGPIIL